MLLFEHQPSFRKLLPRSFQLLDDQLFIRQHRLIFRGKHFIGKIVGSATEAKRGTAVAGLRREGPNLTAGLLEVHLLIWIFVRTTWYKA